jgi:hypothetical protein
VRLREEGLFAEGVRFAVGVGGRGAEGLACSCGAEGVAGGGGRGVGVRVFGGCGVVGTTRE